MNVEKLHADGCWIKDEWGRVRILRGVNLSGSSKVPAVPNGATHRREGFFDHRNVSFVGRPFPLEEADEHFARLRSWGLTFLRFLVTWEAIEHCGPGIYDEEYLDYAAAVIEKAGRYGMQVFIDPHQDVWSRFCGGDGAPGWTLEAAGMEITRLHEAGAALVHAFYGDPLPRMIWYTNADKLAAMTMFTLFFGGNVFAPRAAVAGEPIQEFLQRHYLAAFRQLALRLQGLPNVVGYEAMNEPDSGMIGKPFSSRGTFPQGEAPTLWQSILLGAGIPQRVDIRVLGFLRAGRRLANPRGVSIWKDGGECLWKKNGVWELDGRGKPRLLRPDHFTQVGGRPVDFHRDFLQPFQGRFAREIRRVAPEAIFFVEGAPLERGGRTCLQSGEVGNVVNASHWYDLLTINFKNFVPWFNLDYLTLRPALGAGRVLRVFVRQMAEIKRASRQHMGDCPTLIGEFGIPFDMNKRRAFRTGDFSLQTRALDANFRALEANLLGGTLWNYTPDNTNERGDQWNDEDFSIFSRDQATGSGDLNDGGRALQAAVRPYARAVAGEPLSMTFDMRSRVFRLEFQHDPEVTAPTEVFLPQLQYPRGFRVEISDGEYEFDCAGQLLCYRHSVRQPTHTVMVFPP